MFYRIVCQALLTALLAVQFGLVHAATLTVTELGDSGPGTLRAAIGNASTGDTIDFQAGLSGPITLESPLPALDFDLTVQGPGADVITVSGANQFRVFFVDATVTISGLTIADGLADAEDEEFGGGIWNLGTLTLTDSLVTGNVAVVAGGGIANDGTLIVQRSEISGNSTADPEEFGAGGGIDNFGGSVAIIDSTIANNTADSGGGIENANNDDIIGRMTILNSTISGNSAADFGGGIDVLKGEVSLVFSTVANNSATFGGGIANLGDFLARNSLVANNPAGGDCDNAGISFEAPGTNFDTDGTCPNFTEVNSGALELGPLADNGGATLTHALGEDSVAVDAASECTDDQGAVVATDQRGVSRPQGAECDVGAFELEVETEPAVQLDPDFLDFGDVGVGAISAPREVIIENTGTGDLEIGPLGISGLEADDFSLGNDNCTGQTISPSSTCTFEVTFTPLEAGIRMAQVEIPSNAGTGMDVVFLEGNGIVVLQPQVSLDPEQLDFGDIDLIGQPSEVLQVTVTNTGSGDLDIGTLAIQGSQAGDFDFGGDVCSGQIVAPDANCTFEVIFTPQAAGIRRAWVSIPSNAPGSPHRVDLLGTQDVIFFDGFESDQ